MQEAGARPSSPADDGHCTGGAPSRKKLDHAETRRMTTYRLRDPLPSLVAITSPAAGEGVIDELVERMSHVFDAHAAWLAVPMVAPAPRVQILAARDAGAPREPHGYALAGSPCEAVHAGQLVVIPERVSRLFPGVVDGAFESYLGVPLRDETGRIAGHLALYAREARRYGDDAIHVARIFGHRAEAELSRTNEDARRQALLDELRRVNEKLLHESITDSLTGAYNRRYFDEACEREFLRARRYGRSFSLLVLDIDHFKGINDTFGHHAGDEVLRAVAKTIRRACRDRIDTVARIGGEEFGLLAVETSTAVASLPERVRSAVAALEVDFGQVRARVTASIGMATIVEGDASYVDVARRADRALYLAKHEGRNRVKIAEG